jgi:beta-lactamase regulating signal transducer with metallopeptidase domain
MEAVLLALQRAFPVMLRMSLSAAVLTGVVVLLRFLLRKAPKRVLCLLWLLVAVRLLCPALPRSGASLMPPGGTAAVSDRQIVSAVDAALPVLELETPWDHAVNQAVGEAQNVRVSTETSPGQYLPLLWAAGTLAMLLYALVSFLRLRRRTAASVPFSGKAYLCDGADSPFILGVLRPRIFLPSGLEELQLSHVLAHERAHLRRLDQLWKPLGFLLLAVHWFNPALWLAYILFCRDMELACDERAVRDLDPAARADYAQALLDLSRPGRAVAACPLAFGEAGVKQRVKNVLNYRKPAFWIILGAVVLGLLSAVFFLTDPVPLKLREDAIIYAHYFDDYGGFELDPEAGRELAGLIRQYGKRRIRNTAWSGTLGMSVTLGDEDHQMVTVEYRYANSYSFWKGVEDDYHSVVYDHDGQWRMEFDFDGAFLDWKNRWIPSPEERKTTGLFYGISRVVYVSEGFREWMTETGSAGTDLPILPEVYDPTAPAETWPKFCVTPEKTLLIRKGTEGDTWIDAGRLHRFDPTADNFDRYYRSVQDKLPDLRKRARNAWRVPGRDMSGSVFYDLLELETGQLYLAYGYYDESEAGDPYSDDSTVYWLARLDPVLSGRIGSVVTPMALREKYPEYYDLPTDKGLELYVWQLAEGAWSCGLMAGTNREKTNDELWNLRAASVREMQEILASYKLPAEEIAVIPIYVPYSSYMYVIDEDYRAAVREMFFGKEEPVPLLSVSCSGEDSIFPYFYSRWSETWTGDGFLAADGEPVEAMIAEHRDEIPILLFRGELKLRLAEGVSRSRPLLRVYDQELTMLISEPDEDLAVLEDLPPGTYWCSLVVSRKGTYIPEADRCESYGYNCIFRLEILK